MENNNLLINDPSWIAQQEQKVLDSWQKQMLSEKSIYQEKFHTGGPDFGKDFSKDLCSKQIIEEKPLVLGTPGKNYPGNFMDMATYPMSTNDAYDFAFNSNGDYRFDDRQRGFLTDIYKYVVHFGIKVLGTHDELGQFKIPDEITTGLSVIWNNVPKRMTDVGLPIEQYNYELALFINGLSDGSKEHIFSNQFCNAFVKASGIKFKGDDQRVPTSESPFDPGVLIYHNLMTNYKQVKSMPLSILSQMFIEDHKEYEVIEYVLHGIEPIKYNVLGSELNDIQKTKVISYVLDDWHKNTIKKYETPEAIKYHENGGYIPNFEWAIPGPSFSERHGYAKDARSIGMTVHNANGILNQSTNGVE